MKSLIDSKKPKITKQRKVDHPRMSGKKIGYVGWEHERGETVFVQERSRDSSLYNNTGTDNEGGYSISEDVITELKALGVERVYIGEYETGDVYQFSLPQFLDDDVAMRLTHHRNDPQRCIPVNKREYGYRDYLDRLYNE